MNNSEYVSFFEILNKKGVSQEKASLLLQTAKRMRLKAGDVLVKQDQVWDTLIVTISGSIRFYYYDSDFNEINKFFLFSGECIAPIWDEVHVKPSDFEISALCNSVVFLISYNKLQKILNNQNEWLIFSNIILNEILTKKIEREKMQITLTPPERYQYFLNIYKKHINDIPLKHIASFISITSVSLSRIRKRLKKEAINDVENQEHNFR